MHLHKEQMDRYITLFNKMNFDKMSQLNLYLTKNKLWTDFRDIMKLNTFSNGKKHVGLDLNAYKYISNKLRIQKETHYVLSA